MICQWCVESKKWSDLPIIGSSETAFPPLNLLLISMNALLSAISTEKKCFKIHKHYWFFFTMVQCNKTIDTIDFFITAPRNRGGVIFSLQFVCVCVCVSNVFLWTKFQPNGCTDLDEFLAKWLLTELLEQYWNWWPWIKGQGHSDSISIFLHNSLLNSLL